MLRRPLVNLLSGFLYKSAYSRSFFTLIGTVLKEVRVCFVQFFSIRYPFRSFLHLIAVLFSSLIRLFLGKTVKYSFAYTGEDRIIEGILKPLIDQNGYYVDVGCNHPKFLSNTYGLYRKGWRGICIDANSKLIHKFRFMRPRDKAIAALVSNSNEIRSFFLVQNNVLSTTDQRNIEHVKEQQLKVKEVKMKAYRLTDILKTNNCPQRFELLSIDVEEHDFEVLNSLDLNYYSPEVIIVEDESLDIQNPSINRFTQYLQRYDYELVGHVLTNSYYKKSREVA